ncbi:hypothetical protein [Vibrio sp. H11]|uniref:hypothetical protein n=1 Tax=Vibrio sp. H11 TaxID=2565928 RepID=UPI001F0D7491|nr:hypothetical protein [Vibrio sp. H11]
MSLITSAKSVKLYLFPSFYAHIVALLQFNMLIWALLISAIPVVVSLVIIAIWLRVALCGWLTPTLSGAVDIDFSGRLRTQDNDEPIRSVGFKFAFAFVVIVTPQRRWLLWRDSCRDGDYRQLLMRLKREL